VLTNHTISSLYIQGVQLKRKLRNSTDPPQDSSQIVAVTAESRMSH
jgi:hypothetical protein